MRVDIEQQAPRSALHWLRSEAMLDTERSTGGLFAQGGEARLGDESLVTYGEAEGAVRSSGRPGRGIRGALVLFLTGLALVAVFALAIESVHG
jgi:hypothetical protein